MTIGAGIMKENFITIALSYYVFACCTIAIFMLMDTMECLLHAVRLHWFFISFLN